MSKNIRSIVEKLGPERLSKIKVVGNEEVEKSLYGQLVLGKGMSSSLDEQLAKEARKAGRISVLVFLTEGYAFFQFIWFGIIRFYSCFMASFC